jgi:hypothetical protein
MFRKLLKSLGVVQDKKHTFRAPVRSPFPDDNNDLPPRAASQPRSMTDPMNPRNPFGLVNPTSPNKAAQQQRHSALDPSNPNSPTNPTYRRHHSPFSPTNPSNPNSLFNAGRKRKF